MSSNEVPIYDDKAEIRETIDLSDAQWLRAMEPEGGGQPTFQPAPPAGSEGPIPEDQGEVEIAFVEKDGATYTAMRSSATPEGPILIFTEAEWDAFVKGARDGEFDLPME